ncbi:MAG: hypothetical protein RI637_07655 [Acidimicrobiia bacterium]|nr:hypothetical protein [Acidimicrobiia bacterium]
MITGRFFKTKDEAAVIFDISVPDEVEGVSGLCVPTEWEAIPMRHVAGGWKAQYKRNSRPRKGETAPWK